jgi:hypothetical protein
MKNLIKNISRLSFALILFSSCEKVIDLDLNTSNPQLVVEAKISDDPTQKAQVRISKSINFDESNVFPPVKNAVVILEDKTSGQKETLTANTEGVYETDKIKGVAGHTYFLTIQAEGKTLSATSSIPRKVNLDSIIVRKQVAFGNESYQIIPKYTDPKGVGDNYRFVIAINDTTKNDIYVIDDELSDGNVNGRPLFRGGGGDNGRDLQTGDKLTLEMQCIDSGVYDYFNTLSELNDGNSATPANPITNIKGGALGYFATFTKQSKSVIIK